MLGRANVNILEVPSVSEEYTASKYIDIILFPWCSDMSRRLEWLAEARGKVKRNFETYSNKIPLRQN